MENQKEEARVDQLEARLAFCEERLRAIERFIGDAVRSTRPRKRELTDEEKKAIRARLIAGQEKARLRREAEGRAQAEVTEPNEEESSSKFIDTDLDNITLDPPKVKSKNQKEAKK